MSRLARSIASVAALGGKRGVTAVEYGLILGLIAIAIVAAVNLVAGNLSSTFNTLAGFFGNS